MVCIFVTILPPTQMKIITYNVNGIRAAFTKGWIDWVKGINPDIVLLQETKAEKEQVDTTASGGPAN